MAAAGRFRRNLADITSQAKPISSSKCGSGRLRFAGATWFTELPRCRPLLVPGGHLEAVKALFDERPSLVVPASDAESLLVQHHPRQAAHDHRHDHRGKRLEIDAAGLQRHGPRAPFDVAETHTVRDGLAA